MKRDGFVYFMMNNQEFIDGFTKRYRLHKLVYFEVFDDIRNAIAREKQIKAGSRKKKIELIKASNPQFRDLYEEIL